MYEDPPPQKEQEWFVKKKENTRCNSCRFWSQSNYQNNSGFYTLYRLG